MGASKLKGEKFMNYSELKKEFQNNKSYIKDVINNEGCRIKLRYSGRTLLKFLLKNIIKKLNKDPKFDNSSFDYISFEKSLLKKDLNFDDEDLAEAFQRLKYYKLITIRNIKGGYTGVTYNYITFNFNNFKKFLFKGKVWCAQKAKREMALSVSC